MRATRRAKALKRAIDRRRASARFSKHVFCAYIDGLDVPVALEIETKHYDYEIPDHLRRHL